jgi:hypothetical protein
MMPGKKGGSAALVESAFCALAYAGLQRLGDLMPHGPQGAACAAPKLFVAICRKSGYI